MVGKEKDRQGAALAGGVALLGVLARFTVFKDSQGDWTPTSSPSTATA